MTSDFSINYEKLQSEAMLGLVRSVLENTAKSGLPGDHHFYISFITTSDGVSLSPRLKEKYPQEMTIVLQHRFWDLIVNEDYFEVKLTFDGIPERLVIPFRSLKVFFDPSVRYGVQFDQPTDQMEKNTSPLKNANTSTPLSLVESDLSPSRKTKTPRKNKIEKSEDITSHSKAKNAKPSENSLADGEAEDISTSSESKSPQKSISSDNKGEEYSKRSSVSNGAEVLSLDKFRKK